MGDWIYSSVVPWILSNFNGSPFVLSLLPGFGVVVAFALSYSVSEWMRRYPPATGAIAGNILLGVVMLFVAWTVLAATQGRLNTWVVVVAIFIGRGVIGALWTGTYLSLASLIQQFMVPDEERAFVRIQKLTGNACRFVAGGIFTVSVATDLSGPVWFNAASFLLLAMILGLVRRRHPVELTRLVEYPETQGSLYQRVASEIAFALRHRRVRGLILGQCFLNAGFCVFAFLPLIVSRNLGGGELPYGLLLSASGLGGVAGSSRRLSVRNRTDMAVSATLSMICVAALGYSQVLWQSALLYFVAMFAIVRVELFVEQEMQLLKFKLGEGARFAHRWLTQFCFITWLLPGAVLNRGVSIGSVYLVWSAIWLAAFFVNWRLHADEAQLPVEEGLAS